ncbi:endonuclease/exonuclease/phosphatase [Arachidicoccus ginsenosidimutans]|uniref:endonuclease/exonuclease/phosphatase family protein n=1 Tax=Arachidicoccus sp. BS20 TaxID=1850526 RepID=UPI0007F14F2A|nr:endonuclease/exonuclease/phosphatase [Arachidicoccus sp. BS20]ANI89866.1 endonuclease/exonuclease/phosphatase [Arachidicoccus sp. BS20]
MKRTIPVLLLCVAYIIITNRLYAQTTTYNTAIVAFYNLENFYDTINNTMVNDEDFLPDGKKAYTSAVYKEKVKHLASVIAQIGTDINPDGPAVLGCAEIENDTVLNDLIHHPLLAERNYRFIHYDSRDPRGVDVALIYNPKYFKVESSRPLFVQLPRDSKTAFYTRDILWVTGYLNGERVDVLVNHWPSRYGGEKRSTPARAAAAIVARKKINELLKQNPHDKIILMGDLNDDPVNVSIAEYLDAGGDMKNLHEGELYNPWVGLYKKGLGTLAYQDAWSLFDQIMLSQSWLDKKQTGFFFYQNHVFKKEFMIENMGRYKGYPLRTYDGDTFHNGYSDHFPTYIILLKKR